MGAGYEKGAGIASHIFDDVTSIKTEQFKSSARGEPQLSENHLFSHSQSQDSLAMISQNNTGGFVPELPSTSVDGQIKDRMLAQLSLDNKNMREELTDSKG